jgi:nudix-type nucleoside diphosphatase (YffH/AdpP family)
MANDAPHDQPAAAFRILGRRPLHRGFLSLDACEVEVVTHDGRRVRYEREVEHHGAAVAVLTYDATRRVAVLVRQVRVPAAVIGLDPLTTEVVAGLIDGDEAPEAAARRETIEEVGLAIGALEPVGAVQSAPGWTTETLHLFLAEVDLGRDRVADGGGAAHEQEYIEIVEMPLAALAAAADAGTLNDMKTLLLVQTLRLRRPVLFA